MSLLGFFNVDKPPGMTSRDVVNAVQRRIRGVKVGHAGTLDPLARGVLVIGVGPAVRLVPYLHQTAKAYRGAFRLGVSSASGDTEEAITERPNPPVPTREELDAAAAALTGEIVQTPPAYSAIWVDGRRAYDRVRDGETVDVPSRRVRIDSFVITRYEYPNVEAEIRCGSGTYIRSLGIDLAAACGTAAVMTALTRTAVGPFSIDRSIGIEAVRDGELGSFLVSPLEAVAHLPRVTIDDDDVRRMRFGQPLAETERTLPSAGMGLAAGIGAASGVDESDAAAVDRAGRLRGIVRWKRNRWRPYRVFPDPE